MAMQLLSNVEVVSEFIPVITVPTTSSSTSGLVPGNRWTFVDVTATGPTATVISSQGDFGSPRKSFRAVVFIKAPIVSTSTGFMGPLIQLEAATSTGFTTGTGSGTQTVNGLYVLDSKLIGGTATGSAYSVTLVGTVPTVAGCQFARVNFVGAGSSIASSTAVDVIIDAA